MLPATTTRVTDQTPDHVNERIRKATEARVARCASRGPAAIRQRLVELDHEWDMERALEANASAVTLLGLGLGLALAYNIGFRAKELRDIRRMVTEHAAEWLEIWHDNFPA